MRFSLADQLSLPCLFEHIVPGQLHTDGRRYLPLIVLRLEGAPTGGVARIGVVDRHHLVDPGLVGRVGSARLLFLLSRVRLLEQPRAGLFDAAPDNGRASTMPEAYGRVAAVGAWEAQREHLPYESLYAELLIDLGHGTIGVRTSDTAPSMGEQIGKARLEPGDWVRVERSRIDILGFEPADGIA